MTFADARDRFDDLGFAKPDVGRELRQGAAEVIYGPGKHVEQVIALVRHALAHNTGPVMVTRLESPAAREVAAAVGGGVYTEPARLLSWRPAGRTDFAVTIVSGGTADGPVAAEAEAVASVLGLRTELIADVGVAGPQRIMAVADRLRAADAVICVAGMEGALSSVVGGLVGCPVIAVPTSVGYGAAFEGIAALLSMLSSCAAGMVVVNIDSGFGAAMAAHRIAFRRRESGR